MTYFCTRCAATAEQQLAFCVACGSFEHYMAQVLVRTAESRVRGMTVATARDLAATEDRTHDVMFVGPVPVDETTRVAVWGPPGSGKSTLMLTMADALSRGRAVLYASAEEGLGHTVRDKLRRLEIRTTSLYICGPTLVGDVLTFHKATPVGWFFLDSYSHARWNLADLSALERVGVSVVFSLHATKTDDAAGPMALTHGADVVIAVRGGKWETEKNRFGPTKGGELWR